MQHSRVVWKMLSRNVRIWIHSNGFSRTCNFDENGMDCINHLSSPEMPTSLRQHHSRSWLTTGSSFLLLVTSTPLAAEIYTVADIFQWPQTQILVDPDHEETSLPVVPLWFNRLYHRPAPIPRIPGIVQPVSPAQPCLHISWLSALSWSDVTVVPTQILTCLSNVGV